jgi:hypothetical protein
MKEMSYPNISAQQIDTNITQTDFKTYQAKEH